MTIDKAIEVLHSYEADILRLLDKDFCRAIELGIEALKREKGRRSLAFSALWGALPGETKE